LETYREKDNRIVILSHKKNKGLSAARNTGLKHARGQYILFVDSDDRIKENLLQDVVPIAEVNAAEMVIFGFEDWYEEGYFENHKPLKHADYQPIEACLVVHTGIESYTLRREQGAYMGMVCLGLYSRKFIQNNQLSFYEGILHEDNLFSFQCMLCAKRVIDLPETYYIYYHRNLSIIGNLDVSKSLCSRFTYLCILFQTLETYPLNDEEKAIAKDRLFREVRTLLPMMDEAGEQVDLSYLSPERKLYYEFIQNRHGVYVKLTDDMLRQIYNHDKVYIYGAGMIGKDILCQLMDANIHVDNFIVSKLGGETHFQGVEIRAVKSLLKETGDYIIVLAAKVTYRNQMKQQLVDMGIRQYLEPLDMEIVQG
jgi:glycosyltransferase involved in cell wall biosynthesis